MAGPFSSPFDNPLGSAFGNPFKVKKVGRELTQDEIFQKQMETMVNTLTKAGINTQKVDQRTWLEKLFSVLNTPLAATTSMTSAALGPKTFQEALGNIKDTWTGKKTYGTSELLEDALGKDESFGRKALAFGLGIPMDPLTWISAAKIAKGVGKLAKPVVKGGANMVRAAGYGSKVDDVKNILGGITDAASGVKKFFGYDDFAKFRPKPAKYNDAGELIAEATPDLRDVARQIKIATGSVTARTSNYLEKYSKKYSQLFTKLKFTPDEQVQYLKLLEAPDDKVYERIAAAVSPKIKSAVETVQKMEREFGDELVRIGLIEDVTPEMIDKLLKQAVKIVNSNPRVPSEARAMLIQDKVKELMAEGFGKKTKLPIRMGNVTHGLSPFGEDFLNFNPSSGYVKHFVTPEWINKYPTLASVPEDLRPYVKQFYDINLKGVKSRGIQGNIPDINAMSQSKYGVKIFEDDPRTIFFKQLEELSKTKAKRDIFEEIRRMRVPGTDELILQGKDDTTLVDAARKLSLIKDETGRQPFKIGTEVEAKWQKLLTDMGINTDNVGNLPNNFKRVVNPIFQESGKITIANDNIADILNKMADVPGEATNPLVRKLDQLTSLWKKLAITNPKFHINNWFGSNSNNLIDDWRGTIKNAPMIEEILKGGTKKVYKLGKVKGTADEILDMFTNSGVTSGFTSAEAFSPLDKFKDILKMPGEISRRAGNAIETRARLTAYVNSLKRGLTPAEAAERVFQIHGNYNPSAFTNFEKTFMKRIFPFYTWMKTSAPYQAQSFWNKTGIYSNLAHSQDIVKGDDSQSIPDWLRQRILVGTQPTKDGKAVARQYPLSAPDLEMFANPAQVMLSKINPLIKIPLEIGQNRDVFWGEKLYDKNKYTDAGRQVGRGEQALDYALKQIPMLTSLKSSGLFPKDTPVLGKEGFAQAELASLGLEPNAINLIMAAIAGQLDPTAPRIYDPAREQYAQQSAEAEMMRNLIGRLRRSGVIPESK